MTWNTLVAACFRSCVAASGEYTGEITETSFLIKCTSVITPDLLVQYNVSFWTTAWLTETDTATATCLCYWTRCNEVYTHLTGNVLNFVLTGYCCCALKNQKHYLRSTDCTVQSAKNTVSDIVFLLFLCKISSEATVANSNGQKISVDLHWFNHMRRLITHCLHDVIALAVL